jgi:DNA-binding HxlR family transcriptional regulator
MAKTIDFTAECRERMQSVQNTMEVLGGKWKIKILTILYFGNTHFMELQRRVTGIGSKMLSQELRDLELHGLVKRTVQDTRPITVEYEMTPYGATLKEIIEAMEMWGRKHRGIEAAIESCIVVKDAVLTNQ